MSLILAVLFYAVQPLVGDIEPLLGLAGGAFGSVRSVRIKGENGNRGSVCSAWRRLVRVGLDSDCGAGGAVSRARMGDEAG